MNNSINDLCTCANCPGNACPCGCDAAEQSCISLLQASERP